MIFLCVLKINHKLKIFKHIVLIIENITIKKRVFLFFWNICVLQRKKLIQFYLFDLMESKKRSSTHLKSEQDEQSISVENSITIKIRKSFKKKKITKIVHHVCVYFQNSDGTFLTIVHKKVSNTPKCRAQKIKQRTYQEANIFAEETKRNHYLPEIKAQEIEVKTQMMMIPFYGEFMNFYPHIALSCQNS